MATSSEEISRYNANSNGKTDANLANDSNNLGGIPAEQYATQRYVQEYHDNKEALLKEYIDNQDANKLAEAKAYTDQAINNQDFSTFAKLTDVSALNTNLITLINKKQAECQNEVDTRINNVVSDVNDNFDDVNTAINTLNNTTSELFQSVSNGKQLVAGAITDKGVSTSANDTFSTMATNIRNIPSSGGEYDENYVNTADATATAGDILSGKTAYAQGQKLYGTKIIPDYPTYGTDTTGSTASASDLALGKTAFSNGEYLVGTGGTNAEVEEIYATGTEASITSGNIGLVKYPDSNTTVTERTCIAFSKNGKYCVSVAKLSDSSTVIESHPVNDNGLYIYGSQGETENTVTYKKYRYTLDELHIGSNEVIQRIRFGVAGYLGSNNKCLLIIQTWISSSSKCYYHLYTYHLNDGGAIGEEYEGEQYTITNYLKGTSNGNENFIFSNTNPYVFWTVYGSLNSSNNALYTVKKATIEITVNNDGTVSVNMNFGSSLILNMGGSVGYDPACDIMQVSPSDDYLYMSGDSSINEWGGIVCLDSNLYPTYGFRRMEDSNLFLPISNNNQFVYVYEARNLKVYDKTTSSWSLSKSLTFSFEDGSNQYVMTGIVSKDETKIILITSTRYGGSYVYSKYLSTSRVVIIPIDDIQNAADGSNIVIPSTQYFSLNFALKTGDTDTLTPFELSSNIDGSKILIYCNTKNSWYDSQLWILDFGNTQNLIGVNYKGQFFRSLQSGLMSATSSDVLSGKTFIGYNGSVQTGTLSITTNENENTE